MYATDFLVAQVFDIAMSTYPVRTNRNGQRQIDFGHKQLHAGHIRPLFPAILEEGRSIPTLIENVAPGRPCTHKPMKEIIAELKTRLSTTEEASSSLDHTKSCSMNAIEGELTTFPLFMERLLEKINEYPGSTDAQLSKALGKLHQYINQEARLLESAGKIVRVKLGDGLIHNYPHRPLA
jgi:hypothetical protein